MGQPFVPPIQRHLCRPTTKTSSRRTFERLTTNVNSQVGDVVNPTGEQTGTETPGGSGGQSAHALYALATTQSFSAASDMVLSSTSFDTDGWYSAGVVTVGTKGLYLIQSAVLWQATAGDHYSMLLTVNGSGVGQTSLVDAASSGDNITQETSETLILNATDVIAVRLVAEVSGSPVTRTIASGNLRVTFIGTA